MNMLSLVMLFAAGNRAEFVRARFDLPCDWIKGRPVSWAERLNRAVYRGTSRVRLESLEIQAIRARREMAVRAAVYQENSGITGRAVFGGVA